MCEQTPGYETTRRLARLPVPWTPLDREEAIRALRQNSEYHLHRREHRMAVESRALAEVLSQPVRELRIRWNVGRVRRPPKELEAAVEE